MKNSAENWYKNNCELFLQSLAESDVNLEISYTSDFVTKPPCLYISFNDNIIFKNLIHKGNNNLKFNLCPGLGKQKLGISMLGKNQFDTKIKDGVIVEDTFIQLNDLKINNYKLLDDYDFFQNYFTYKTIKDNQSKKPLPGFWENAILNLSFDTPFDFWYNNVSQANSKISKPLKYKGKDDFEELVINLEAALRNLK